jgi:hypothetical protein
MKNVGKTIPNWFLVRQIFQSLVLCACFVYRYLSLLYFYFVCSSLIYRFWLPLWYLQTHLIIFNRKSDELKINLVWSCLHFSCTIDDFNFSILILIDWLIVWCIVLTLSLFQLCRGVLVIQLYEDSKRMFVWYTTNSRNDYTDHFAHKKVKHWEVKIVNGTWKM